MQHSKSRHCICPQSTQAMEFGDCSPGARTVQGPGVVHMPVIPAFGRLRQEDLTFEASLGPYNELKFKVGLGTEASLGDMAQMATA